MPHSFDAGILEIITDMHGGRISDDVKAAEQADEADEVREMKWRPAAFAAYPQRSLAQSWRTQSCQPPFRPPGRITPLPETDRQPQH